MPPSSSSSSRPLLLLACSLFLVFAHADVDFPNFQSTLGLRMTGSANRTTDILRLTPSRRGVAGCAWYAVKQQVAGGFVGDFSVRIANEPDQSEPGPCRHVSHQSEHCVRGAGDGLAFVVQNADEHALGGGGGELGIGGIANGVAVELDTWYDAELEDGYGRHAAVLTGGRGIMTTHHGSAIGTTTDVPSFNDGTWHDVRVTYEAEFRADAVAHKSFRASPHLVALMAGMPTAEVSTPVAKDRAELFVETSGSGLPGRDRHPLGTLALYVDDMADAVLTVPVNLGEHLHLDHGRAWIGFCAATGAAFANHDIQRFRFSEGRSRSFETTSRAGTFLRSDLDVEARSGTPMELDPDFVRAQNSKFNTDFTYELSSIDNDETHGGPDDTRSVAGEPNHGAV